MPKNLIWHGDKFVKMVEDQRWENMQRAVNFYLNACKRAVSRGNPWPHNNSSKPNEPPKLRTGFGRGNIIAQHDKQNQTIKVGVRENAAYMAMWEVGIRGVKRPWMLPTLMRLKNTLARIMGSELPVNKFGGL